LFCAKTNEQREKAKKEDRQQNIPACQIRHLEMQKNQSLIPLKMLKIKLIKG
jgi:hypothetical protein